MSKKQHPFCCKLRYLCPNVAFPGTVIPVMTKMPTQSSRRVQRSGYTLLELTISIPLLTLLMLGMASAIHIAARSVPDAKTAPSAALAAASVLDQLGSEFSYATSITTATASELAFATPDRTGDGVADTLRYRWSGSSGAPLIRNLNGQADEVVLHSVQQFTVTYDAPVDAASGHRLLNSVTVQLLAPAGATRGIHGALPALNRPKLP